MKALFFVIASFVFQAIWAQSPTAAILCFNTDKIVTQACDEIEKRLNQCKASTVKVIRQNNPNDESIRTLIKTNSIPPNSLFFVVGHGLADADHAHYIATKQFWKDHPERVTVERVPQLLEEGQLIKGKSLNSLITSIAPSPAIWNLSCHSGGNCTEGGNIGASCSSWESTAISQMNPLIKVNLKLDPATRRIINLLCEPNLFSDLDRNKNQFIDGQEWLDVFNSDNEKKTSIPLSTTTEKGQETIAKQASTNTLVCKTDKELLITQLRCVNAASPLNDPCLFTPVLSHFSLPHWDKQRAPRPQLELHQKELNRVHE